MSTARSKRFGEERKHWNISSASTCRKPIAFGDSPFNAEAAGKIGLLTV
jgi:hypothetical protein